MKAKKIAKIIGAVIVLIGYGIGQVIINGRMTEIVGAALDKWVES